MFATPNSYCVTPSRKQQFMRIPERASTFLRDVKRRSLRVKRSKSLISRNAECRLSGSFVQLNEEEVRQKYIEDVKRERELRREAAESEADLRLGKPDEADGAPNNSSRLFPLEAGASLEDINTSLKSDRRRLSSTETIDNNPRSSTPSVSNVSRSGSFGGSRRRWQTLVGGHQHAEVTTASSSSAATTPFSGAFGTLGSPASSRGGSRGRPSHDRLPLYHTPRSAATSVAAFDSDSVVGLSQFRKLDSPPLASLMTAGADDPSHHDGLCPPPPSMDDYIEADLEVHEDKENMSPGNIGSQIKPTPGIGKMAPVTPIFTPLTRRRCGRRSSIFTPSFRKFTTPGHANNMAAPATPSVAVPEDQQTTNTGRKSFGGIMHTPLTSEHKKSKKNGSLASGQAIEETGQGRIIPIKQGYLYKKSGSSRMYRRKYVALCNNGTMTYYPSFQAYVDNLNGKEIQLQHVTVKIPGQKPTGLRSTSNTVAVNAPGSHVSNDPPSQQRLSESIANGGVFSLPQVPGLVIDSSTASLQDPKVPSPSHLLSGMHADTFAGANMADSSEPALSKSSKTDMLDIKIKRSESDKKVKRAPESAAVTPAPEALATKTPKRKRHRLSEESTDGGSTSNTGNTNSMFELVIVSLDCRQWHFQLCSQEEGEEWVSAIENQIHTSLKAANNMLTNSSVGLSFQGGPGCSTGFSLASQHQSSGHWLLSSGQHPALHGTAGGGGFKTNQLEVVNGSLVESLRLKPGNEVCVDCEAVNPAWASLNLGTLMCIECSGIHRNLGSHISKVRSLDLDSWTTAHLLVVASIGNSVANSVWEGALQSNNNNNCSKPINAGSSREVKEAFIRSKYLGKCYLAPKKESSPDDDGVFLPDCSKNDALANAIQKSDMKLFLEQVVRSDRQAISSSDNALGLTPLQLAVNLRNVAMTQLLLWNYADVEHVQLEAADPCPPSSMTTSDNDPASASDRHEPLPGLCLSDASIAAIIQQMVSSARPSARRPNAVEHQVETADAVEKRNADSVPDANGQHQQSADEQANTSTITNKTSQSSIIRESQLL